MRQLITVAVILVGIIGGVVVLFNTVLAPSPEAVARLEAENAAYAAMEAGDFQAALAAIEAGLVQVPDDPSLLLLKGVLLAAAGQEAEAERIFSQVESSFGNPINFYLQRSQLELRVNRPDKAEADARQALALDENSAPAWLLLGQALETQGRGFEAIGAYERAGDLAFESGNNQIVVLARLALARLGGEGIPQQ
jgi:tetratricopeptide (TPR) repeat protein